MPTSKTEIKTCKCALYIEDKIQTYDPSVREVLYYDWSRLLITSWYGRMMGLGSEFWQNNILCLHVNSYCLTFDLHHWLA